jgi:hypothetical protein
MFWILCAGLLAWVKKRIVLKKYISLSQSTSDGKSHSGNKKCCTFPIKRFPTSLENVVLKRTHTGFQKEVGLRLMNIDRRTFQKNQIQKSRDICSLKWVKQFVIKKL